MNVHTWIYTQFILLSKKMNIDAIFRQARRVDQTFFKGMNMDSLHRVSVSLFILCTRFQFSCKAMCIVVT